MSYTYLSNLIERQESYVRNNWDRLERSDIYRTQRHNNSLIVQGLICCDKSSYFLKKHVLARIAHCVLTPFSLLTNLADTTIGIGSGIVSVFTAPLQNKISIFAMNHLDGSRKLMAQPYVNLLNAINPYAKFSKNLENKNVLTSDSVNNFLKKIANDCYNSNNFLKRHIASRLTYALHAISSLVTRSVDGIIGLLAATFSILSLGKFKLLNNLAYKGLQAPAVIKDFLYCAIKIINPGAETQQRKSNFFSPLPRILESVVFVTKSR